MELFACRMHGDVFRVNKEVMGLEFFVYVRAEDKTHAMEKAIRTPHKEWARVDRV